MQTTCTRQERSASSERQCPVPLPCSGLAQLHRLQQLEVLDLGWCRAVGDADAAALGRLPRLRELNLARTQVGGWRRYLAVHLFPLLPSILAAAMHQCSNLACLHFTAVPCRSQMWAWATCTPSPSCKG